jgi:hypothetical protein
MAAQKSITRRRLIKTTVEALPIPTTGHAVYWDEQLTGLGCASAIAARGRISSRAGSPTAGRSRQNSAATAQ